MIDLQAAPYSYGTLTLDFDPDLLLDDIPIWKAQGVSKSPHCEVCVTRSKILRTHPEVIHFDAEADDFLDDAFLWSYIHPDELASWA